MTPVAAEPPLLAGPGAAESEEADLLSKAHAAAYNGQDVDGLPRIDTHDTPIASGHVGRRRRRSSDRSLGSDAMVAVEPVARRTRSVLVAGVAAVVLGLGWGVATSGLQTVLPAPF